MELKMGDERVKMLRAQIYEKLCYRFTGDKPWMFSGVEAVAGGNCLTAIKTQQTTTCPYHRPGIVKKHRHNIRYLMSRQNSFHFPLFSAFFAQERLQQVLHHLA